jgi:hypothetical protein
MVLNLIYTVLFFPCVPIPVNTYPILQEDRLSVDEALNHPYFQEPM